MSHQSPATGRRHIVIVSETFAPEVNGVAHTLLQLCLGLRDMGYRVSLIRPRQAADRQRAGLARQQGWCDDECLVGGLPLPGYPELRCGVSRVGPLRRWLAAQSVDAVYVATPGPLGLAAVRAAKALGLSISSGFHTNFHSYLGHYRLGLLAPWLRGYCRWLHNQTRVTLVPSAQGMDELRVMGIHACAVWSRGVDGQMFSPAYRCRALRAEWGVDESTPVLLYVGRLAAEKNLPLVLRSYQALYRDNPQTRLVMVGDGPLRERLQAAFPQVIFAGIQRAERLARYYASADIFLFPSLTDTFGNVVLEAMASGLAVVAFDRAAAREHLRSLHNGLVVPVADEAAYIAAVRRLYGDRQLRQQVRLQARSDAMGLGWPTQVRRFVQLLLHRPQEGISDGDRSSGTLVRTG